MKRINKVDLEKYESRKRARLVNSLSGLKSANLIATKSNDGVANLSLVSSVVHIGADPALLGFIIRPDSVRRDTLENIRENHLCTLNHVNEKIVLNAHQASARYDSTINEFQECSLTEEYLDHFTVPYVAESIIKIGLKFVREVKIEENGTHFLIMGIENVYLPDETFLADGSIDFSQTMLMSISGLDTYHTIGKSKRLSYAKPFQKIQIIS